MGSAMEGPGDKSLRTVTARESAHIAFLVETFMDRDAAFLFSLAQQINLLARRKHRHTEVLQKRRGE